MTKNGGADGSPTMIIPSGTEIEVDVHGQLSIRTPGNLVIQNSGNYSTLESVQGSIRIEPNVQVEAVNIRCAETCYVQGQLTAWRVTAKSIELEDTARAHIILQESSRLEVGREARLVGNFSSEKELFLLFSRFAKQFRSIPFYFDRKDGLTDTEEQTHALEEATASSQSSNPKPGNGTKNHHDAPDEGDGNLPGPLQFACFLLEREAKRTISTASQRVIEELVKLIRGGDVEALRHTHRTLFGRITEASEDVKQADDLVRGYYDG